MQLIKRKVDERMSASDALRHPFLASVTTLTREMS
jgi:hypothetical protein